MSPLTVSEPKGLQEGTIRTGLVFLLCFILAQADKQVIGLISVPIKAEFDLSDFQLGFLQGGAFALAFAVGGLPIARLLDTGNRLVVASICVAFWSFATVICGLATSFLLLDCFRALTAVAEAGLPPAAFSIFSQAKSKKMTARLTSTFMLAPFLGGGLVFILGGVLLKSPTTDFVLLNEPMASWRAILILTGLGGFILAPLLAVLGKEPHRVKVKSSIDVPSYREVFKTIFVRSGFLKPYYLALTFFYLFLASLIAWYPTFLVREFGLDISEAGKQVGLVYLTLGSMGTLFAISLVSAGKEITAYNIVKKLTVAAGLMVPFSMLIFVVNSATASVLFFAVYIFFSAAITAIMVVPVQMKILNNIQARSLAILSLLMSAFAGSLGPLIVGFMSSYLSLQLGSALVLTGVAATSVSFLLFSSSLRHIRKQKFVDGF